MSRSALIRSTTDSFRELFQTGPQRIFLSPGRINLIGEHIDYNDGFVLPAAIYRYTCFAISAHHGREGLFVAHDLQDTYACNLDDPIVPAGKMWANYLLGILQQVKARGFDLQGFRLVFSSDIPMGAGLSSSAALECGFAYALNELFGLGLSREAIARMGQQAEHTFVGVNCGIMDQFASVFGKKGHAIRLDCTTLDYDYHTAGFAGYGLLLLDSNVKHTHLTSGYNDRRREVESGLALLKERFPDIRTFRDVSLPQVLEMKETLGDIRYRRARYVVQEIARVRAAVAALDASDLERLGQLMYDTHEGLSSLYEVSCKELDFLVSAARDEHDVAGARMMGGGFGGCSINLVRKGSEEAVAARLAKAYREKFGLELGVFRIRIADGTKEWKAEGRFAGRDAPATD
jgi:galactokinase